MSLKTAFVMALLLTVSTVLAAVKYAITIGAVWYEDGWLWLTLVCACAAIVTTTLYVRAAERAYVLSVVHPANLVRSSRD